MDQPIFPAIGQKAPHFRAQSTTGTVSFPEDYQGRWVILFSQPGGFTPVGTTETIILAHDADLFARAGCALLGLTAGSAPALIAWVRAMESYRWGDIQNQRIPFPIVADRTGGIARLFGIHARGVVYVDPQGVIRAVLVYPESVGFGTAEMLRLLEALQAYDSTGLAAPCNWQPGQPGLLPAPRTAAGSRERTGGASLDWYLSFGSAVRGGRRPSGGRAPGGRIPPPQSAPNGGGARSSDTAQDPPPGGTRAPDTRRQAPASSRREESEARSGPMGGSRPRTAAPRASVPQSSSPQIAAPRAPAPRAQSSRDAASQPASQRAEAPRPAAKSSAPQISEPRVSAPRAPAPRAQSSRDAVSQPASQRAEAPRPAAAKSSAPRISEPRADASGAPASRAPASRAPVSRAPAPRAPSSRGRRLFTLRDLASFDGRNGRQALAAIGGLVYDIGSLIASSPQMRLRAGHDLSKDFFGLSYLLTGLPVVGRLVTDIRAQQNAAPRETSGSGSGRNGMTARAQEGPPASLPATAPAPAAKTSALSAEKAPAGASAVSASASAAREPAPRKPTSHEPTAHEPSAAAVSTAAPSRAALHSAALQAAADAAEATRGPGAGETAQEPAAKPAVPGQAAAKPAALGPTAPGPTATGQAAPKAVRPITSEHDYRILRDFPDRG